MIKKSYKKCFCFGFPHMEIFLKNKEQALLLNFPLLFFFFREAVNSYQDS